MLHLVIAVWSATVITTVVSATSGSAATINQRTPVPSPKAILTAGQRKLNTKLLNEIDFLRRQTTGESGSSVPRRQSGVRIDDRQRALVDVRAPVSDRLVRQIDALGGTIVSSSQRYDSTVAWVPILMLERLATDEAIRSIYPASEAALQ